MDEEFFSRYSKQYTKTKGIPGFKMNSPLGHVSPYKGRIGLELEIEATRTLPHDHHLDHIRAPKTNAAWLSVTDGSLRGEAREYIFTQPCSPDELPHMVHGLFNTFASMNSVVNNSNRCSTHVHINMSGKTVNVVTSVLCLWGIYEQALIDYNGEERQSNHFCLSFKDSNSIIDAWSNFLRFGHRPGREAGNIKYAACNILPLWSKGSLEFRCGKAADEPNFPIVWATFIERLCTYAETRYANPATIGYELSERGAYEILVDICKESATLSTFPKELLNGKSIEEFNDQCLTGFRQVQSLAFAFPWDEWMREISKVYIPNPFNRQAEAELPLRRNRQQF